MKYWPLTEILKYAMRSWKSGVDYIVKMFDDNMHYHLVPNKLIVRN